MGSQGWGLETLSASPSVAPLLTPLHVGPSNGPKWSRSPPASAPMAPGCCTTASGGDGGSQAPTPLPGPPAMSPMPDGHVDIDPSTSRLCRCRVTATNSTRLRLPAFKDHLEMCRETGLHSRAEPAGPAWHPVPSPDCHLELDLELPLRGEGDRQGGQAGRTGSWH